VSAPWIGGVLDRLGARRVIVPALALSGCAVASLSALTAEIWHLRMVFAVLGLATMGASPIAYSRAIFGWFDARRGQALGLMLAGSAVSAICVPPVAHALIRLTGWRIAWLVLGSTTLTIALPTIVRFVRDRHAPRVDRRERSDVSVAHAVRSRVFWTFMIVVFGATMAINGVIVHLAALLTDRGLPAAHAALAVSAMGGASLAGRLLTGWLLDRFSAARVSVVMLTIAALGTFILAGAQSLATGLLAAACIGFGSGGEVDVIPYLLSRYFGLRSLSTLYGINWTAWGLAGAAGPILLGRAFDATGSYSVALTELGLVTLAAAALMLTLPAVSARAVAHDAVQERV